MILPAISTKSGTPVALSLREFDLLYELMKNPAACTREMLLERVWKTEFFGDTSHSRRPHPLPAPKIEDEPDHPQYILTVRGVAIVSQRIIADRLEKFRESI